MATTAMVPTNGPQCTIHAKIIAGDWQLHVCDQQVRVLHGTKQAKICAIQRMPFHMRDELAYDLSK
jgi:hypothetical protein